MVSHGIGNLELLSVSQTTHARISWTQSFFFLLLLQDLLQFWKLCLWIASMAGLQQLESSATFLGLRTWEDRLHIFLATISVLCLLTPSFLSPKVACCVDCLSINMQIPIVLLFALSGCRKIFQLFWFPLKGRPPSLTNHTEHGFQGTLEGNSASDIKKKQLPGCSPLCRGFLSAHILVTVGS